MGLRAEHYHEGYSCGRYKGQDIVVVAGCCAPVQHMNYKLTSPQDEAHLYPTLARICPRHLPARHLRCLVSAFLGK